MRKIILLLLTLCLIFASCGADSTEETDKNDGLSPAYNFTIQDTEGNTLKLNSLLDKPVVLNFWASWCPPCKGEMPDFEEAYKTYMGDINFVMVSVDDSLLEAVNYINSTDYTFPVYYDVNGEGSYLYSVSSIPRTYFINTDGYIVKSYETAISKSMLEKGIELLK